MNKWETIGQFEKSLGDLINMSLCIQEFMYTLFIISFLKYHEVCQDTKRNKHIIILA